MRFGRGRGGPRTNTLTAPLTSRGFDVIACCPRVQDVGDLLALCIGLHVLREIVLISRLASNGRRKLCGAAVEHSGDAVQVRAPRDLEDGDDQGDAAR
jgi:hypothetical protein